MRDVEYSSKFKHDFKLIKKRGKDLNKIRLILELLINNEQIPSSYKDHPLKGDFASYRELHIEPDWLLIYIIFGNTIRFERTGSHTDLFG